MNKNNKDTYLKNKIIDLYLKHSIEESNLYFKFLDTKIKSYESQLAFLENTKPFFFQKNKLKNHNKKIEECQKELTKTYIELEKEMEIITKINNDILKHQSKSFKNNNS